MKFTRRSLQRVMMPSAKMTNGNLPSATVFTAQLLNSDEDAVGRMLNHPNSIVSLSNTGAHLTFFNDAGFGLHLLGHWARDRSAMTMEEAVRRLTSHPAEVLGLSGRGTIREGHAADPGTSP